MRRPQEIDREVRTMATVGLLAGAFEGIASMHIIRIKDKVMQSGIFFDNLWHIYTQLRIEDEFHSVSGNAKSDKTDKELIIVITSEGSMSGDIDQRLIEEMLKSYNKNQHDIIAIGHHGAIKLRQIGIACQKEFDLPANEVGIDFGAIVAEIQQYRTCRVYYQSYISLMRQDIKNIELSQAVEEQGRESEHQGDFISKITYILEPSASAVVDHMKYSILQIMLGQVVLESKLAQYASRFQAMTAAHSKAREASRDLDRELSHAKRALTDERAKEILNGLRRERMSI
jgi:F-type H+-transporting ATPase subunit gamma